MSKFHNKKTVRDGITFDSQLELSVYSLLRASSDMSVLRVHPIVKLTQAKILCKPDFECVDADGSIFYVEAKGFETAVWRIKRKLWLCYGPAPLHVYKGTAAKPVLHEVLINKGNV